MMHKAFSYFSYFPYLVSLFALVPYVDTQIESNPMLKRLDKETKNEIRAAAALVSKLNRLSLSITLNFTYTDLAVIGVIVSLKQQQIATSQVLILSAVLLMVHCLLVLLLMQHRMDAQRMTIYDLDAHYRYGLKGRNYLWLFAFSVLLIPAFARWLIEGLLA